MICLLNISCSMPMKVSKGWSRDMLKHALKSGYHLSIQAVEQFNNFTTTLPAQQAEYDNEVFRSSYNLGFVDAAEPLKELDLERRLVQKITTFIMGLGDGFSFIGNQHTFQLQSGAFFNW